MNDRENTAQGGDIAMKWTCYWNDKLECTNELYCDSCEHQPADKAKPNGRKTPVDIRWQNAYGMMVPCCPVCGEMAYSTERCKFCGQSFNHNDAPPENKREIMGASAEEDGILVCDVCGNYDTMELVSHSDGAGFFDYTYRCGGCGSQIIVRTFLLEEERM